jgi:deoxycytidylate deaminase
LVRGSRVLATGINIDKNHPSETFIENIRCHASVHAEASVIRQVPNARGCVLYIARVNKHGQEAMSRPCDGCFALIIAAGIKKIIYTTGE